MAAADDLENFAKGLPKGAFWLQGETFARFVEMVIADRIRADGGNSNLTEQATEKGRFLFAQAGGGTPDTPTPPLTVVAAPTKADPNRVRVYKGFLGGLRPAEMNLVDGVLPDGTDNRCYLSLPDGAGYVYGKLLIDTSLGAGTEAHVYATNSPEDLDGTFLYLLIAQATTTDGSAPEIEQIWTEGNWYPAPLSSGDGTTLSPAGQ